MLVLGNLSWSPVPGGQGGGGGLLVVIEIV